MAEPEWNLDRLSTPSALKVLRSLGDAAVPASATDLATAAQVSLTTVRDTLSRAIRTGWAQRVNSVAGPGLFVLTDGGRDHLRTVINNDAAVNVVDDRPSSTTMTSRPGRGGKPAWCRPGVGVCLHCQEPT